MFGTILHRMIFRELIKVFLLCLISLTGVILMGGVVAEASRQGLGLRQILSIIPLVAAWMLPYTIPATTLFATCVVYGRLSADNEILAIRASGINILKVISPALIIGVLTSVITMGLYYRVIPYTHHLMKTMFLRDVEELLYTMLKQQNQISYPQFDYSMFVQGVQGKRLIKPVFKHRDNKGETDAVAQAQEAELRVDMDRKVLLVRMFRGDAWAKGGTMAVFEERTWDIPLPENLTGDEYRKARDLTWEEMRERLGELEKEREFLTQEQTRSLAAKAAGTAQPDVEIHLLHLDRKLKLNIVQRLSLEAEMQMRPALSMGCFFFVLVGCPIGIWFSRSDYLSSFITCFLPIVFIYYPVVLCGTGMAKDGLFHPFVTVWAANGIMGILGLYLFSRLLKN